MEASMSPGPLIVTPRRSSPMNASPAHFAFSIFLLLFQKGLGVGSVPWERRGTKCPGGCVRARVTPTATALRETLLGVGLGPVGTRTRDEHARLLPVRSFVIPRFPGCQGSWRPV